MLHRASPEVPPAGAARAVELWGLLGFRRVEAPAANAGRVSAQGLRTPPPPDQTA
ncbi:MAG: hypothetical protein U0R52_03840 [Solirubrobacterales bacterium]